MNARYAIEIAGLVKRYPTSAVTVRDVRGGRGGDGGGGGRGSGNRPVASINGLISLFRGHRGPFIQAIRGIDLQIREGETFGILGPNGAGKTTLIKILCTLVIHDEGEVFVNGLNVKKEPRKVLENLQAVLPESRGFNWRLTGRQNLQFFGLLYGLKDIEARQRINYLFELTNMQERADDGYQRYSTGMQRKLLLCRALLRNTSILLFDEPTAGLDPQSAAEFRSLLHDKLAREERKTIVLSTHNLIEAESICDRIAILDRGQIKACDTPTNVRHMLLNEKILDITFTDVIFTDTQKRVLKDLEAVAGVNSVSIEVDQDNYLRKISVRTNKDTNISSILNVITRNGLNMSAVNTIEPSLEDAFMAITGRHPERPDGSRRLRGI